MDSDRKEHDPTLVCTCNDLYINDIQEAIDGGEEDYLEIMQYNDTYPRCGECQSHVEKMVQASINKKDEKNALTTGK